MAALIDEGRITSNSRVAIVGGGAAGLTAAAAIALAIPEIKALDVYERKPDLLHLQLRSPHRYLHPHIYDWPHPGSLRLDAGLPILDWSAGPAGEVAKQILSAFDQISERTPKMQLKTVHRVERVDEFAQIGCRLRVAERGFTEGTYDIALLSIGFGYEKATDNEQNRPYWDAQLSAGPLRGAADTHDIFVSGNGDGGLVDFMVAAFDGRAHHEILDLITSRPDLDAVKRVLLEIETEAWKPDSTLDIYEEYERRLPPVLPGTLLKDVVAALRRDADVCFHTHNAKLFRPDTAILNRFVVFLALHADQRTLEYKFRVLKGCEISNDNPLDAKLRLTDGTPITPTRRYLRFGSDTAAHHAPFLKHIESFRARHPAVPATYQPATPPLTASAIARFSSFATVSSAPRVADRAGSEDAATGPPGLLVRLSKTHDGNVVWSSDLPSSDVRRAWADHAPEIILRCEMTPDEAGPLRYAVARLIAHSRAYRLYCHNSHGWTAFLREFYGERRPGPGVDFQFRARLCADEIPEVVGAETVGAYELASRIHLSLDHDVLDRLNLMVERCLRPTAPVTIGWALEAGLRRAMARRWREWHNKLLESDAKRRRFLVLLVSPDDDTDLSPAGLVRVGPKCVEPYLLRATLLALAFSLSTEPGVTPSASFPGNLAVPPLSAHTLGAAWLDGVDVGPEVSARPWSTDVVLLSELREPPLHEPILPRMDHTDDSVPGIRDVPLHEQPLILGCTTVVRSALGIGEVAVREYFTSVLRERARTAARMLG